MDKTLRKCLCSLILLFSGYGFASVPVWTITPLTPVNFSVTADSIITVQYQVENQSRLPHILMMQPITGVRQITTNGFCSNSFELNYQQSCILNLEVKGSDLQSNLNDAPVICQAGSTLLCYQPAIANRLSVSLVDKVNLIIDNSPLSLIVGGGSGFITVTNPSTTLTLTNLHADLTGTPLSGNVTQDSSNCVNLLPGQHCNITFSPLLNAVTLSSFPIEGGNANPGAGKIQIAAASVATLLVTGSPLTLQATTGTPVTGSLTITNQSNTVTALNISADISGALTSGGVVEDNTNCNTLLPQQVCHLVFTPGTQAISNTNVSIQGSNTSVTSANIAVNAAPQAVITITAGTPLSLITSGSNGVMTIKNNSSTEYASSINSNFTSTALNGLVSQTSSTCSNVAPGASCALTFSPGSTAVAQTNFPIQGSNTSSVTGAITIAVPIHIIFVSNSSSTGNLSGFTGANASCNSDSNKPSSGFAAGYTYKALLFNNNATTNGVSYYRTNGTTLIAVANGGNLVGNASLTNAVQTATVLTWTGSSLNNCSNWTVSGSGNLGSTGLTSAATSMWFLASNNACSTSSHLYCVSQ